MIKHLLKIPEAPEGLDGIDSLYADAMKTRDETVNLQNEAAENLRTAVETLAEMISFLIKNALPICKEISAVIQRLIDQYPNKRVIHLAKHGKQRTRKKNINRIKKYFEREAKKRSNFAQN